MTHNETPTNLELDTIDLYNLASMDPVALACLNLDTISVDDLAAWLGDHGAAHLSQIERIELAERLTRRRFLIGAGGLLGAAALGACGAGEQAAVPRATVAATRTITDDLGRVVDVPVDPQRVVVLDPSRTTVQLVELGLTPVGATHNDLTGTETSLFPAILGDMAQEITSVGLIGSANLEEITSLQPDLILYNMPYQEIDVELLATIAPTVAFEFRPGSEANLRFVANVVGRTEQAEALIAGFEDQLDERAQTLQLNGRTISVPYISFDRPTITFFGPETLLGRVIIRLGGTLVPSSIDGTPLTEYSDELSLEVIPELVEGADTIIALRFFGIADTDQNVQAVLSTPLWQTIPAVQRGDIVIVDGQAAVGTYGYLGMNTILDELASVLQRQRQ